MHAASSRMLAMVQELVPELSGPRDALRSLGAMRKAMREHLDGQWAAAQAVGPDLIVYHPQCLAGPHIAEALGVPGALSIPLPFQTSTRRSRSRVGRAGPIVERPSEKLRRLGVATKIRRGEAAHSLAE